MKNTEAVTFSTKQKEKLNRAARKLGVNRSWITEELLKIGFKNMDTEKLKKAAAKSPLSVAKKAFT